MKTSHILIIIGVVLLIIFLVNYDKIFGSKKKFKYGGDVRFVSNENGIMNDMYYCCKEVNAWGGCQSWQPQDYPCE